jgi:hypothetical protein
VIDWRSRFTIAAHQAGEHIDQEIIETIGSGYQDARLRRRGSPVLG